MPPKKAAAKKAPRVTGNCLCGQISYAYTGSHYTWNVVVPTPSFKVTGSPSFFTLEGASGKKHPHYFCGNCGSSVYSQPEMLEGLTVIKAGTISGDKADKYGIQKELFVKDREAYLEPIKGAIQDQTMT